MRVLAMVLALGACTDSSGPAVVVTVEVVASPGNLVAFGETRQLSATARDASGNAIAGRAFTWESTAPTVASVDATGLVSAIANGEATISASLHGKSAQTLITVLQTAGQLAILSGPANGSAVSFLPPVDVEVRDARGHLVLAPVDVTISLASNPDGATLGGTTTVTPQAGIARFDDLWIDRPGAYVLAVTSGPATSPPSEAFTLGPNVFAGTWTVTPTLSADCAVTVTVLGVPLRLTGEVTLRAFGTEVPSPRQLIATPRFELDYLGLFPVTTLEPEILLPLDQTFETFGGSVDLSTDTITVSGTPLGTVLATTTISLEVTAGFTGPDTFTADIALSAVPRLRISGTWRTVTCDAINGTYTATRTP